MFTLYSVTALIFLMGYTASLSIKKHGNQIAEVGAVKYSLRKCKPVIYSYVVASAAYLIYNAELTVDNLFMKLLTFSACGPMYFIKYYVLYQLIAPIIFALLIFSVHSWSNNKKMLYYICISLILLFIGDRLMVSFSLLGGSYLSIFTIGMIFGYEEWKIHQKKLFLWVGLIVLVAGWYASYVFYGNRILGINIPTGIDRLVPNLQMNPPNLSICLYTAGVMMVGRLLFEFLDSIKEYKAIGLFLNILSGLGKYSLDIFLWHELIKYALCVFSFQSIWLKRIVFYGAMFGLPVLFRIMYTKLKNYMYSIYQYMK